MNTANYALREVAGKWVVMREGETLPIKPENQKWAARAEALKEADKRGERAIMEGE